MSATGRVALCASCANKPVGEEKRVRGCRFGYEVALCSGGCGKLTTGRVVESMEDSPTPSSANNGTAGNYIPGGESPPPTRPNRVIGRHR